MKSLTRKMNSVVFAIFLVMGVLLTFAFILLSEPIVQALGTQYAINRVLREKSRVEALIDREVALSMNLADSPLIKKWCQHENDPSVRAMALAELASVKNHFMDRSAFLIMAGSGDYYYVDDASAHHGDKPRYAIDPNSPRDAWFHDALNNIDTYELNLDEDVPLNTIKVWINAIIWADGKKVGMAGTGLDLTKFLGAVVQSGEDGVEVLLLDRQGNISAYKNSKYIKANALADHDQEKIKIFGLIDRAEQRERFRDELAALADGKLKIVTFPVEIEGKRYLAAGTALDKVGWLAFVLIDLPKIINLRTFWPIAALMAALLALTVFVITLFVRRMLLEPIAKLSASARDIAGGNYAIEIQPGKDDEIGALTESFNEMIGQIRQYTGHLEEMVRERTRRLEESKHELELSNKQVLDSINYARVILQGALPQHDVLDRLFPTRVLIWLPRDVVGGDMYYASRVGRGRVLAVADCTGHGVPGALMVMTVTALLTRALSVAPPQKPGQVLAELNRLVKHTLNRDPDARIDSGLDIGLCYLPDDSDELVFAGAKLPLHVVENGRTTTIAPDRRSLGYRRSPENHVYADHMVAERHDKLFFLATDGILDMSGGEKGLPLGKNRLGQILASLGEMTPDRWEETLLAALEQYAGPGPHRDDIVIFGFKP